MTDDEVILAVRAHVADSELPDPASADDVRAVERVVGHPMPALLRRLSGRWSHRSRWRRR